MHLAIKFSILVFSFVLLSACVLQKDPGEGFVRITYPGESTLYYSQMPAKDDQPFVVLANEKEFHIYGKAVRQIGRAHV